MSQKFIAFKSLILIFIFAFFCFTLFSQTNPNHVWVEGYIRKDGTSVRGHFRTAPNHTNVDNFSTLGNVNPYTGELGTIRSDGQENPWKGNEVHTPKVNYYEIEDTWSKDKNVNSSIFQNTQFTLYEKSRNTSTTYYSTTDNLNIRKSPSVNSEVVTSINKYDVFKIVEKSDSKKSVKGLKENYWYKIERYPVSGWVFGEYVEIKESCGIMSYNEYLENIGNNEYYIQLADDTYWEINGDNVNIRETPSLKSKILKKSFSNTKVKVVQRTKNKYPVSGYESNYWYKINLEGVTGWVYGALISPSEDYLLPKDWNGKFTIINASNVNVRNEPTINNGKVITKLNYGDEVEVIAKTKKEYEINSYGIDYWYYIKRKDVSGWVFGKLLEKK